MAKYETTLRGDFASFVNTLDQGILDASVSAKREDASDYANAGVQCAVRVYERYSVVGSNRVSLSITVLAQNEVIFVSAITSGGSEAVLFKINTLGENSFLQTAVDVIENYTRMQ